MSQKGFSKAAVLIASGFAIIGTAGYFIFSNKSPLPSISTLPTPVNNTRSGMTGMLSVVTNCVIPEGCGPKYTLWDMELNTAIPLLGNINEKDTGLVIRVFGDKTTLPPSEYGEMMYRGTTEAIRVTSYSVLSRIPYRDFLVEKAGEYTLQKYPCLASKERGRVFTKYNKTFSWEYTENNPVIKVKMTDKTSSISPEVYYELWYNGNSGDFIKEVWKPKDIVFCKNRNSL